MIVPDPVLEAAAYQATLLAALGDDDPAVVQSTTPLAVRALVAEAGPDLRTRPDAREWSVSECIGHIFDSELVVSGRYRWILAHDVPEVVGYDQDLWVARLDHGADDPEELLSVIEALRHANLALWARRSEADRARIGMHRERGAESYDLTFRLQAGHDRVHLDQARRALVRVRGG